MTIDEIINDINNNRNKYIGIANENLMEDLTEKITQYPSSSELIKTLLHTVESTGYWERLAVDVLTFELENIPNHGFPGQMIITSLGKKLEELTEIDRIRLMEELTEFRGWSYQMIFSINPNSKEAEFGWQYKHDKSGKIYSPFDFDELIIDGFESMLHKVISDVSSKIKSKLRYKDWCKLLNLAGRDEEDEMFYVNSVLDN